MKSISKRLSFRNRLLFRGFLAVSSGMMVIIPLNYRMVVALFHGLTWNDRYFPLVL